MRDAMREKHSNAPLSLLTVLSKNAVYLWCEG